MENEVLATVEAIYAAGLNGELWPGALAAIMRTVGGIAATLEVFDRRPLQLVEFHAHGLPPANETGYLEQFATLNPRIPALINGEAGTLVTDYTVIDESGMRRNPFYEDFLAPAGYRYFVGGIVAVDERQSLLFSVQRSIAQGHVDRENTASMLLLLPHVRQAFDMTRRLRGSSETSTALQQALDWLTDGVAVIKADGTIVYANDSFRAIAGAADGLRIKKNVIEFAMVAARNRFAAVLAGILALRAGDARSGGADFAASRPSEAPPYLMSIRPLPDGHRSKTAAAAIVLIRDPLGQNPAGVLVLREIFGLTDAEAAIAQALQNGISLGDYARTRAVSLNTVYTHLRRIREKTGCRRLPELIGKLNEVRMPLRAT